jgi:outer membrane protein OmpA-like peptidoglycan-associated protein
MLGILLMSTPAFAQEDREGCKDHPLFSRMQAFYIHRCEEKEFAAEDFIDPATKQRVTIEGRMYVIDYGYKEGFLNKYSQIQISRNYVNAIKKIGGTAYEDDPKNPGTTCLKLVKEGKEIWAMVYQGVAGIAYVLTIVEKQAMAQEVVADAKTMAADISTSGKVAIYGIYFDFNKADVKPESEQALKEIAKLLSQNPKLKLYVVGHTDNVGGFDYNMKLSQQRAEAVVKELVSKYKVDGTRLKPLGVGPVAPVTSNETEEGRATNRRVELVEQ